MNRHAQKRDNKKMDQFCKSVSSVTPPIDGTVDDSISHKDFS